MFIEHGTERIVGRASAQTLFLPAYSIKPVLRSLLRAFPIRRGLGITGGVNC